MCAKRHIIPVFIPHLGCPHDCVFCNQRRISGSLSPATAQDVTLALETGLSKLPQGASAELAFYGGSFTAIPAAEQEALLGAAKPYLSSGALASLRLSTRPDAIDARTMDRLCRFGVGTVELGVQSMDERVLLASGRGHTSEDAVSAARMVKAAGFSLVLQMMTGLPESTPESDIDTARRIAQLRPDGVRIYPTVIIRDTALYELWRSGAYREHTVEDAVAVCAEILPIFRSAGVPVIRLGLNPTDELSGGAAAGGAYHPALGELVLSRIMLVKARALLADIPDGAAVRLGVHPSRLSQTVGQHGFNRKSLVAQFDLRRLDIVPAEVDKDEIRLISVENANGK